MLTTFDTVSALARSRTDGIPLKEIRSGGQTPSPVPSLPGGARVADLREAVISVLPKGVTAIYTAVVLPLVALVPLVSADEIAARVADEYPNDRPRPTSAQLRELLEATPKESSNLIEFRYGFLILTALVIVVVTYSAASEGTRAATLDRTPVAEPLVALSAFLGWALGGPGTPLAASLGPNELAAAQLLLTGSAALVVWAVGSRYLTRQAQPPFRRRQRSPA